MRMSRGILRSLTKVGILWATYFKSICPAALGYVDNKGIENDEKNEIKRNN